MSHPVIHTRALVRNGLRYAFLAMPSSAPRLALALALLAMLAPLGASAQPAAAEAGWTRLADFTVIRSAERVHRVAVRDATPVDLLYVGVDGNSISFESAEVRRADGTTQVVEIRRPLGAGRDGVYLALCGDAAPVTRVLLRHAPGEPRYNTRVRLLGRARAPSEGAVPLPCGAQPEARAEPESLPGYAWGATFAEVRARCIADGGTPTPLERDPRHLVCAPFAPLAALEARFYFGIGAARPGLREVQVVRSLHTTGEPMRDALRDELRTQVTTRGRPRSLPYPVHCDVVFFDAPWTCFGSGSYRARYEWGEGSFRVETEWMSARSAHELRFVYRRL